MCLVMKVLVGSGSDHADESFKTRGIVITSLI